MSAPFRRGTRVSLSACLSARCTRGTSQRDVPTPGKRVNTYEIGNAVGWKPALFRGYGKIIWRLGPPLIPCGAQHSRGNWNKAKSGIDSMGGGQLRLQKPIV